MNHNSLQLKKIAAGAAMAIVAGCAAHRPAPVVDTRPPPARPEPVKPVPDTKPVDTAKAADAGKVHVVQRGDTLISVALQNGLDYRELAAWNNIENPNVIRVGDSLRLTPPESGAIAVASPLPKAGEPVATPLASATVPAPAGTSLANSDKLKVEPKAVKVPYSEATYAKLSADAGATSGAVAPAATTVPAASAAATTTATAAAPASSTMAAGDPDWAWPVKGKVLATFTEMNKGIDIAGTRNAPVLAAAGGKVIYNQSGLRGYGRLVIIKHNDTWLSAYAHNEKVLVAEGQEIKKGQKIAEMGSSDTDTVKLHFEIRKQGKPVDPMKFLPAP
jgi:lipoprotein NlpD